MTVGRPWGQVKGRGTWSTGRGCAWPVRATIYRRPWPRTGRPGARWCRGRTSRYFRRQVNSALSSRCPSGTKDACGWRLSPRPIVPIVLCLSFVFVHLFVPFVRLAEVHNCHYFRSKELNGIGVRWFYFISYPNFQNHLLSLKYKSIISFALNVYLSGGIGAKDGCMPSNLIFMITGNFPESFIWIVDLYSNQSSDWEWWYLARRNAFLSWNSSGLFHPY